MLLGAPVESLWKGAGSRHCQLSPWPRLERQIAHPVLSPVGAPTLYFAVLLLAAARTQVLA